MHTKLVQSALCGLLLVVTLSTGCERQIESKDPVRSLPGRLDAPTNLAVAVGDRSVTLSWEMDDLSGVVRYRIYTAVGDALTFTRHDSSTDLSASVSGLPFNEVVRFRVTAVGSNGTESDPSDIVSATVGLLSALIEDDDTYTNSREVQISLTVPGSAAYVTLSEDSLFAGAATRVFQPVMPFTLSQGDGAKRVYARFAFEDGSESAGVIFDEIILDTYAVIDLVYLTPTGQVFGIGDVISFFLDAGGETGGHASVAFPGSGGIDLVDDGTHGDAEADDGLYSFDFVVPIGLTVTDGKLTGDFTDAAGNQADQSTASTEVNIEIVDLPDSVTLAVGLTDEATARLTWTRSAHGEFQSYRVYRDTSSPVSLSDDLIAIITDLDQLSHDDYLPVPGLYYYRVYVFDTQGQSTPSNEVSLAR